MPCGALIDISLASSHAELHIMKHTEACCSSSGLPAQLTLPYLPILCVGNVSCFPAAFAVCVSYAEKGRGGGGGRWGVGGGGRG